MIYGAMILNVVIVQLLASAGHGVPTHVFGRSWLCGLFEHTCRLAADELLSD